MFLALAFQTIVIQAAEPYGKTPGAASVVYDRHTYFSESSILNIELVSELDLEFINRCHQGDLPNWSR